MSEGYNGWTNYPTWAINLWLSNDEELYEQANEIVRDAGSRYNCAQALEAFADELNELAGTPTEGFPADIYGWALGQVDWREIAEHWIEDNDIELDDDGDYIDPDDEENEDDDDEV
jgi:hypothetical protein